MAGQPRQLNEDDVLKELAKLFMLESHDRQVFCVYGSYAKLRPFQKRLREGAARGEFDNSLGRVQYLSLTKDLFAHLTAIGKHEQAGQLADGRRDAQLQKLLSQAFRDLVTTRIESKDTVGLFLSDFELLYAYDLGTNDIPIARQVAINGKRVCLLLPGVMRDGRLWIFDEDADCRQDFPETLLFLNSGWVFELGG